VCFHAGGPLGIGDIEELLVDDTPRSCIVCPWHFYKVSGQPAGRPGGPRPTSATPGSMSSGRPGGSQLTSTTPGSTAAPPAALTDVRCGAQIDLASGEKYFQSVSFVEGKMTAGPWKSNGLKQRVHLVEERPDGM